MLIITDDVLRTYSLPGMALILFVFISACMSVVFATVILYVVNNVTDFLYACRSWFYSVLQFKKAVYDH